MADRPDYQAVIDAACCRFGVRMRGHELLSIDFLPRTWLLVDATERNVSAIVQQIEAYLVDPQQSISCRRFSQGTPFQQRVWQRLRQIPPGSTLTYGALAAELGTSPRAVGNACRANPCPLVVPCHRVVAATGLGGFAGRRSGTKLAIKAWLLRHEGAL